MKRILSYIVILLMLCSVSDANIIGGTMNFDSTAGVTNFADDANCMFAARMNGATDAQEDDISGEGNNMSDTHTSDSSSDVPSLYSGKSRDFATADNDFLQHADGLSTDISGVDQEISIVCWFMRDSDQGDSEYIVGKWDYGSGEQQYFMRIDSNDKLSCLIDEDGDGTNQGFAIGDTVTTTGKWYFGAMVYNDVTIKCYLGDESTSPYEDGTDNHTAGINNGPKKFEIGSTDNGTQNFDGKIDMVAVFDRALSTDELAEIWEYGIEGVKGAND